jgi:hypothetical protein
MRKYLLSHWRGQQGLLQSCLLNGGVLYFLVNQAWIYVVFSMMVLALPWERHDPGPLMARSFAVGALLYMVWACTGIFRCAARNAFNQMNTKARRIGGVGAIAWGIVIALYTLWSVAHIGPALWHPSLFR